MSYKRHYPKGRRAATPYLPDELAPGSGFFLVDGAALTHRLCRAYHRRDRWQYHVARRRPQVPRPPTVAERVLARLRYYAEDLLTQLAPFRLSRPTGHEALRGLLQDADTRPTIIMQVNRLRNCLPQVRPLYLQHQRDIDALRREWDTASPERRHEILAVHRAQAIQDQLTGLMLLTDEVLADLARIEALVSTAFAGQCQEWYYRQPLPGPNRLAPPTPDAGAAEAAASP